MEGFRDIVWRGDKIVWTNLFKHFVYCLDASCLQLTRAHDSLELDVDNIPILGSWDQLPTPQEQRLFSEIWEKFLNLPNIPEIIDALANRNRKIRYRELGLYLRFIHSVLLDEIEESYIARGLMSESTSPRPPGGSLTVQGKLDLILILITHLNEVQIEEKANAVLQAAEEQNNELRIALQLNNTIPPGMLRKNIQLVIYDFPKIYLNEIERLLWPKWYTACFMKNYHNSSVWAHYGDKHKGACLIFKAVEAGKLNKLKLNRIVGKRSGKMMRFHEVLYKDKADKVDFFQSIGRLSVSELIKLWYTDSEDNRSECASHIRPDGNKKEDWQEIYWKNFYRDITTKTKAWEYEQEYRLILGREIRRQRVHGEEIRTRTYNFNSLKGIIFGIKTSDEDKLRTCFKSHLIRFRIK